MKKISSLLLLSCFLLLLSGCFDKVEVEERAYVIAMGLDKAEDYEDNHRIKISFEIANPEVGTTQGGGGTEEPPYEIVTVTVNDFIAARNRLNAVVAKEITYDLLRIIIVSEDLAKDDDFIRIIYDAVKDREIRRDVHLAVSKEAASKYLEKNKPKQETRPHKYFQFMTKRGIEAGLIPDSNLHRFFRVTEHDADLFIAMYTTTETTDEEKKVVQDEYLAGEINIEGKTNDTQFMGSAVFKEGKMIGKLNGRETRIAVLLDETSEMNDVLTTYEDPYDDRFRIATRIIKTDPVQYTIKTNETPSKIDISVPLKIEVLSDPAMINYARNPGKQKVLKEHIEKSIKTNIEDFIEKTQEDFGASPFSLSLHARKNFLTIPEFQQYDWMKSYPSMDISVSVLVEFGEFGKQAKVPYLEETRD
jgi:spore germination protein KC